ncbi:thioredoxin 2 [Gemmata sp. SH-PL17]|uniref:thioredoxin family protein n=1 Tax=Gemmata sp. SH-PL17 TaxID=1630693 RepID=UPI0004B8C304|nr:thioredoxin family protein [Gemmata sp. SH-PL17]AMV26907.1 thioredoxin 2 [Gemmata sp. SH-PL17]
MSEPTREAVDQMQGPVVLEFGATWCPHCLGIQSDMAAQLAKHPNVQHVRVEDGKGKPLGRSFRVKLWPTLVFLNNGAVVNQFVRPASDEIARGFAELTSGGNLAPGTVSANRAE